MPTPSPILVRNVIENGPDWSAWVIGAAAIVQASTAVAIFRLTRNLVTATQQYAKDTARMADTMAEERALRIWELDRSVAQALLERTLKGLVALNTNDENINPGAMGAQQQIGLDYLSLGPQLSNGEVRRRISDAGHMVYTAAHFTPDEDIKGHTKQRVFDALACVKESLEHLLRNDPLPALRLPHYEQVHKWLTAPPDERVEDYQKDPFELPPEVQKLLEARREPNNK